jgi:hypothetical protein
MGDLDDRKLVLGFASLPVLFSRDAERTRAAERDSREVSRVRAPLREYAPRRG